VTERQTTQSAPAPGADSAAGSSGPPEESVDEPLPAGESASEPAPAGGAAPPAVEAGDGAAAPDPGDGDGGDMAPARDDFRDRYLRSAAELDNVRKRARRDVAAAESRGIARLARELLPALDNFERALAAAESVPENADHHLTDGIRLVQSELLGALARVGIEPDSPKGEAFDPHRHEAVAQQPVPGTEPGTIVEVFQSGYRHGEALLRPAKVVVAA
jgi:molecular chaperone GrpE